MEALFKHLHVEPQLAIEFISTFSRFEYALKSTAYFRGPNRTDAAWVKFADDIDEKIRAIESESLKEACNFLFENPPKKQVRIENELKFEADPINANNTQTHNLFLMILTIRNNLFHGGKYSPDGEQEAGRNKDLLTAGLTILKSSYQLDNSVKTSFER